MLLIDWIWDFIKQLIQANYHDPLVTPPQDLAMNKPVPTPDIVPESSPKAAPHSQIEGFCLAIRDYEGKPGDRNYRNNNPGNCRYSSVGYLPIYEPVGKDDKNFAVFKDYATGWLYLKNLVRYKVAKNPEQNILLFMQSYAPRSDGNDPNEYALFIAKRLRVPLTSRMGDLI